MKKIQLHSSSFLIIAKSKMKSKFQKTFAVCILTLSLLFCASFMMAQEPFAANDAGVVTRISTEINAPQAACTTWVGQINANDPTTTLRSFRDGILKTCLAPGNCSPGIAGSFNYDILTWTNPCEVAQCVTIIFSNLATNFSFVTAFNGPPNLANLCINWLGDPGSSASPGNPIVWSFTAPAGATIYFFVSNLGAGQIADYSIEVNAPICICCIPPTITCPGNITVSNDAGQCGANVSYPPATATGTPTPTITYSKASGSFFPVGTTTVTATATNDCGTATCTFTVTVNDNEPPTITCAGPVTINNTPGLCTGTTILTAPIVTDNCSSFIDGPNGPELVSNGSFSSGATSWNACGNLVEIRPETSYGGTNGSNSVAEIDHQPVTLCQNISGLIIGKLYKLTFLASRRSGGSTPPTVGAIVTIDGGALSAIVNRTNTIFSFTPETFTFVATLATHQLTLVPTSGWSGTFGFIVDNVSITQVNGTVTNNAPAIYPIGNTTVTWTATDANGNSATCTQVVTVVDNQPPTITCPANITVGFDPGKCGAIVCYPKPVATDNCPPATPAGYTFKANFGNSYYYQANAQSDYATAQSNAIAAGGHLAVITSAAENNVLNASGAGFSWIGANDLETDGTFKWINCEPFSYSNWCQGEPNGGTFENHLEFEIGGCWNDLSAGSFRYSILEIEGVKMMQTSGLPSGAFFPDGTTVNTFLVTDAGGNTATCSFTVTVIPCIICGQEGNVVVVDQNVTVNLAPAVPTYSGDPDLLPYFSWDKTGSDPANWKAIFNMSSKKLLIKSGATITVTNVPNTSNNQKAPGIVINSTCELEIENGGHIVVNSLNQKAGDIIININGNIIINGEIRNEVSGTNGLPGAITITSSCGNITVGSTGQVFDLGVDPGGNTITLQSCGLACLPGDITVNGLVKAYAHAHAGDLTLNRPTIKVNAANGAVTVNGNTANPLYDEFNINGTKYDIWGGLLSWVRDNVNPGKVEVQAKNDITVNGHGDDPSPPVRTSFGAIAAIATMSSAPGGLVDVRSTEGNIIGNDRAFDVSGRNRLATNFAHINLMAALNISINRLGANNSFNPVVDASSPSVGDRGGRNDLRSYTGNINIGPNALVSAAVPAGSGSVQGTNNLVSCLGVVNNGTINPADLNLADNSGVCSQFNPPHLFPNPCQTAVRPGSENKGSNEVVVVPGKTGLVQAYPNPFTNMTTIRYSIADGGNVQLKVFGITGKEVTTLVNSQQMKGEHSLQWNAEGLPAGVYVVQLRAGNATGTCKLVLIR